MGRADFGTKLPRLAWVAVEPTPFHLALFQQIHDAGRCEIDFFFCAKHIDQPWDFQEHLHLFRAESDAKAFHLRGHYFNPAIVNAVRNGDYDLVVCSGYSHPTMMAIILWCAIRRVPFILQGDTHLLKPRAWPKRAMKRWLLYPVLRRCGAAMGTGILAKKYWESMGIPEDRVLVVPFTCHLDPFVAEVAQAKTQRASTRRAWGLPEEGPVGIFVGRLLELKRVDLVLRALARIPATHRPHLLVVGDGPLRSSLTRLADELGVGATFTGFQQNYDLPALYAAADFFLLPSGTEAWGVVVAEAAASGLPLFISHHAGAAYDFVDDGKNGYIVRGDSPEAWSESLERACADPETLSAMGRYSQVMSERWNSARVLESFFQAVHVALLPCRS